MRRRKICIITLVLVDPSFWILLQSSLVQNKCSGIIPTRCQTTVPMLSKKGFFVYGTFLGQPILIISLFSIYNSFFSRPTIFSLTLAVFKI